MLLASRIRRIRLLTVLGALLAATAIEPAVSPAAQRSSGDVGELATAEIGSGESVVAPVAMTGPSFDTDARSAQLSGSVNPRGAPTSYHFEYGPTTFYGSMTPNTVVDPDMTTVAAAATLGGLTPAWTYHYRLVAANAGGEAKGFDRTFTTWTLITPPVTPDPALPFDGVRLVSRRLTVTGGSITVKLRCPRGTVGRCSGRTTLTTRRRGTGAHTASTFLLGRAQFSIGAGQLSAVRVRVARDGRRVLRRAGRLRGNDTNAARDGAGVAETTVSRVTIRRRMQAGR
jgi:hypothetical protein